MSIDIITSVDRDPVCQSAVFPNWYEGLDSTKMSIYGVPFYYKIPVLWYHKLFCDITNSNLWYKKLFCDITKSILWYQKFDFMIQKYLADFRIKLMFWYHKVEIVSHIRAYFVISQHRFCDVEKQFCLSNNGFIRGNPSYLLISQHWFYDMTNVFLYCDIINSNEWYKK